jgi:hypothetical protein
MTEIQALQNIEKICINTPGPIRLKIVSIIHRIKRRIRTFKRSGVKLAGTEQRFARGWAHGKKRKGVLRGKA